MDEENKIEHECKHNSGCEHDGCCHAHGENCNSDGHCNHHGEGGHCHGRGEGWGGKRLGAGRKCEGKRIPFNRRLSEEAIQKIKAYAEENNVSETEALEIAIKKLIFDAKKHNK